MAQPPPVKPVLQKPPGYRDPNQPPRPVPGQVPRKPVPLPPSFQPQPKSRRSSCCRVFCWVCCILILVIIVVVALAAGIFFLLFDPRLPLVYLRSFQIPLFNTTVKPGGTYLDAWTVPGMEVKNPNGKLDIFYSGVQAYVSVGDPNDVGLVLGMKDLTGFTQKSSNTTSVKFDYVVKNRQLNDEVAKKLKSQYVSKVLRVGVEVKARLGYVVKGWRLGTMNIDVLCGGVTMKEIHAGNTMPKCTISAYKWIQIH
ncbi:NDR1/HIN1-like protein 2 [Rosa sericea]